MMNAAVTSAGAQFRFGQRIDGPGAAAGTGEAEGRDAVLSWQDELDLGRSGGGADDAIDGQASEARAPEADSPQMTFDLADAGDPEMAGEGAATEDDDIAAELTATPEAETTVAPEDGAAAQTVTATYSDAAIAGLMFMIEEEKLAGDIYEAFHAIYGMQVFDNIAASEDQHFAALIGFAGELGLDVDQFLFEPAGSFVDPALQGMYDSLLALGGASATAALEVGLAIEEKDMIDIAAAAEAVEDTPLEAIYENLLAGSVNHLEAFDSLLSA